MTYTKTNTSSGATIEYINNLFKEIPKTKIYIAPGNHDPYTKNSYYNQYKWSKNVKIFGDKIEKIENEEANIYGYGFNDFYCTNCGIEDLELEDKSKLNLLVIHGTLDGASIEEKQYNSIPKKILQEKGFDYIAMRTYPQKRPSNQYCISTDLQYP